MPEDSSTEALNYSSREALPTQSFTPEEERILEGIYGCVAVGDEESCQEALTLIREQLFLGSRAHLLKDCLKQWDNNIAHWDTLLSRLSDTGDLAKCDPVAFETILAHDPSAIIEGEDPPLKRAIMDARLHEKAKLMIDFMTDRGLRLDEEYNSRGERTGGRECLAAAFDKPKRNKRKQQTLETKYIMKLVKLGSPSMLKKEDEVIPLHRLVEFERCHRDPGGQLELVKFLLDRCEESIFMKVPRGTRYTSFSGGKEQQKTTKEALDVYQWHSHTRREYGKGDTAGTGGQRPIQGPVTLRPGPIRRSSQIMTSGQEKDPVDVSRQQFSKAEGIKLGAGNPKKARAGAQETLGSSKITTSRSQARPDDFVLVPPIGADAGYGSKSSSVEDRQHLASQASEKIAEELGLRFLRRTIGRDADETEARRFFEHPDAEKKSYHFTLDMCSKPGSPKMVISHESVSKLFDQCTFYHALRHVALPALVMRPMPPANKGEIRYQHADQLFFFEWLQKRQGVKKIFKVIVNDTDSPHRDEDIINVLAGKGNRGPARLQSFDVEILDWRKTDLCPIVVQSAAPNLQELHLRWSGSNAVLRGWGEPEGLPKLKQLKKIHLHYTEKVEPLEQIHKYVKQFQERIRVSREAAGLPDIKVKDWGRMAHPELIADGTASSAGLNVMSKLGPKKTEAPWLKYVDDFNHMVPDLPSESLVSEDARNMGKRALESVRVALIDDGVNFLSREMANFQNRYVPGRSFDTSPDGPAPAFHSLSGHGTFMARLILRVCPYVKIIPYRLMETVDADGSMPRPEPGSAVKAIKEAINEGVDIISMSWTIKRGASDGPSGNSQVDETFKHLKDVLKSSPTDVPLMFCAASDDGLSSSSFEEYPSAIDGDVFRIGAAHETGQTWPNVTNANACHFLFPGVDFALEDQPQLTDLGTSSNDKAPGPFETRSSRRTGSSVATALAAGLAALLIHCTKLGAYHTIEKKNVSDGKSISPGSIESIQTFHTMKSVLQRLSSQNVTGAHYANPASEFDAATRALLKSVEQDGPIRLPGDVSRLGPIANLARNLIPS